MRRSFLESAIYWSIYDHSVNQPVRRGKVVANLKRIVEVSNLAQVVQELVNPRFIVFNEGVESDHVGFLCIRGFVRQILEHFGNLQATDQLHVATRTGGQNPPVSMSASGVSQERHRPTYTLVV